MSHHPECADRNDSDPYGCQGCAPQTRQRGAESRAGSRWGDRTFATLNDALRGAEGFEESA